MRVALRARHDLVIPALAGTTGLLMRRAPVCDVHKDYPDPSDDDAREPCGVPRDGRDRNPERDRTDRHPDRTRIESIAVVMLFRDTLIDPSVDCVADLAEECLDQFRLVISRQLAARLQSDLDFITRNRLAFRRVHVPSVPVNVARRLVGKTAVPGGVCVRMVIPADSGTCR
jgi:hypothetical protein